MKKTKFPSKNELKKMRVLLSKGIASKPLQKNDSPIEKMKYLICQEIVQYKNDRLISQRELAKIVGEDEALISKIVHYHTEEFTIDRLLKFLNVIYPNFQISLKVA